MRVAAFAAALSTCLASACSYDFDQFARSAGANSEGGAPDAAAGGSDAQDASIDAFDAESDVSSPSDAAPALDVGAEVGADAGDAASVPEAAPPDAESDGPPVIACSAYQGVAYNGHCYYVVATAADEATAELACTATFHLVTITSAEEQAAVTSLATAAEYWIGLSEQASLYTKRNEANFRWTTGEPYTPATSYRNWAPSEPSFPTYGDCVVMRLSGQWASKECRGVQLPFVCERDY
jgi:hypothetical protein